MERNIFKMAVEQKLRFPFKGLVTVEDLYDLLPSQLDSIYKTLNKEVKTANEDSLLDTKTKADSLLDLQIEIVKDVFTQKQQEVNDRLLAKEKREEKQRLLQLLAKKEEEEMQGLSKEEILKKLEEL